MCLHFRLDRSLDIRRRFSYTILTSLADCFRLLNITMNNTVLILVGQIIGVAGCP